VIELALIVAASTLAAGLAGGALLRTLPSVRARLAGLALLAAALPLVAVLLSGIAMFHMGADVVILAVAAASSTVATAAAVLVGRSITAPMDELRTASEALARGDFTARAPQHGPAEVAELGAAFNAMAAQLEELFDARRELVAWASHDLRTPLAAISTGAAVLSRSGLAPKPARIAAVMDSSSRRMERIIRDLLDYTRMRAHGGIPLSLCAADAGEVCARVIEEAALHDPAIAIELHREGDLSGEWDVDRLEQVIGNLVANATRHARPGTPVRVRALGEGAWVRVDVENDGPPVPPEAMRSIFDPFRKASAEATGAAHAGLGLGLYIVRSIVEAHGGTVEVESAPARPVTFSVRVPRTSPRPRGGAPARFWRPNQERVPRAARG
jgi:signal transduction histidine kinase